MRLRFGTAITVILALLLVAPIALPAAQFGGSSKKQEQSRSVSGTVFGANDAPIKEAVVYLKNTKTLAIKSYISEPNGTFHFMQLSPSVDYQLWAESNGAKSAVKTVSSFDSRPQFVINLHIGR